MSLSKPSCSFDKPFSVPSNPCFYKFKSFINIDKIDWEYLSRNPGAIHLLERNPDKID